MLVMLAPQQQWKLQNTLFVINLVTIGYSLNADTKYASQWVCSAVIHYNNIDVVNMAC